MKSATLSVLAVMLPQIVLAAPISIVDPNNPEDPFQIIHQYGFGTANSWGGEAYEGILVAVNYVSPGGKDATTTGTVTQGSTVLEMSLNPFGTPQTYSAFTFDTSLTASWTIRLENEGDTLEVVTPDIDTSRLAPPITGAKLSNLGTTTPILSWETPSVLPDELAVSVYDLSQINELTGQPLGIGFFIVDPTSTEFQVPEGLVQEDGFYSFGITTATYRSGDVNPLTGTSLDGSYESLNVTFLDFYTGEYDGVDGVYLPVIDTSSGLPQFIFDNLVKAGIVEFYDPIVAVGYDFSIGSGDPNFASFVLPLLGDGVFELWLSNGSEFEYITDVLAGDTYSFGDVGVGAFRILGIEPELGVNPFDTTAFAVGLSFVADGRFTGSMQPITVDYEGPAVVPIAGSASLMLTGLAAIGAFSTRLRRNTQSGK
jgi:hypothetical protein